MKELERSEDEAIMAKVGNANYRYRDKKKVKAIEWRRNQMKELQLGNIDLLTYQKRFHHTPRLCNRRGHRLHGSAPSF